MDNNIVNDILNNYSVRSFMKFANKDTSPVLEVPEHILRQLQQAVYNKEYEIKNPKVSNVNDIVNEINTDIDYFNTSPFHKLRKLIFKHNDIPYVTPNEYLKRTISYENYNPIVINGTPMVGIGPGAGFIEMAKALISNEPSYDAQHTIGKAYYTIDPGGNVKLKDTYNVNKDANMGNFVADLFHNYVKQRPQQGYNFDLDLGNMNNWDYIYTGNNYTRPKTPENKFGKTFYSSGYSQ